MKRKLINFDAFKKIEEGAISSAEAELAGAEEVLSKTLGVDDLKLHCYGESDVTYRNTDSSSFLHANYKIGKERIVLENIEELVIEEESEKKKAREVLTGMVESLLDNNEHKAGEQFEQYLGLPVVRRELVSEEFKVTVGKPSGKHSPLFGKKQNRGLVAKRIREMKKTKKKLAAAPSLRATVARKRKTAAQKLGSTNNPRWRTYARKVKPSTMKEWSVMCENVFDYLDYKEFGPAVKQSQVQTDDRGNVTGIAMPTAHKRNEGKILSFNWKTLDHEVKIQRSKMKNHLSEDTTFCKAMADLNRYNKISDNNALEETLEAIVTHWPDVLYLTQTELAGQIGHALEVANVKNYDDQICNFMAEGILWKAHSAYTDRVRKITSLAGIAPSVTTEGDEAFKNFLQVCEQFYPHLDESDKAELRVFADLYKALSEVFKVASETGDEVTRNEVANYLHNCEAVLNRESQPDLTLAENIANFLYDLSEGNVEGAKDDWDVSNSSHETISGDHPRMSWAAKQNDAVPSKYPGDWGGTAPVSDGKSYHNNLEGEMRNSSWSNYASDGTYPDLKNPYLLAPFGDYKMKEKSAVDDGDNDWSRWQSSETWPNLQNPMVKPSPWDKDKYKMKSDNLVTDH